MKMQIPLFLNGLLLVLSLCSPSLAATSSYEGPSPCKEESVMVVADDGVKLSGKVVAPIIAPKGALLLLPGSGNVGMNGDVSSPFIGSGHGGKPARLSDELAFSLARGGVATLRYSKRGYEDPTELPRQTIDYLVRDAASALKTLRGRFPLSKIGIVGFSEGALIASMVASGSTVEGLFLMGLPARPIDEILSFQFGRWPLELIKTRLDLDHDGRLSGAELERLHENDRLPLLGADLGGLRWTELDGDRDKAISIETDLIPAYQKSKEMVLELMKGPAFSEWYQAMKRLPSFSDVASKISAPVYLYHGMEDSQVDWRWVSNGDQHLFRQVKAARFFQGLGHCFAPLEGTFKQNKTSGPLSETLLDALTSDVREAGF